MIRKTCLTLLLAVSFISILKPCADGYWDYYDYNSLILSQELINQPEYFPYLLDINDRFYKSRSVDSISLKNGNILEWSNYLNIDYDKAYYLVFKATESEVGELLKGNIPKNKRLDFIDKSFIKKNKEALNYIYKAKQLEPFMRIWGGDDGSWYSYEDSSSDISSVPYTDTTVDLQEKWKEAKSKEIKLRYAYQLVRLAHYYKKYDEAVVFFDSLVEPLNYRPEMYYYALSQKAGALRGLGQIIEANHLYLEVFSHSQDLKETAVTSIRFNENIDFENLIASAKTEQEKNDADLLVGFISFSNPLVSASRIIKRSPDAVQAKVLVARAIAQLYFETYGLFRPKKDQRYPILSDESQKNLSPLIHLIEQQAESPVVKNKNYWNITLAYLYFVSSQFDKAEIYLSRIAPNERGYEKQKNMIASFVDVAKIPVIDTEAEDRIALQYLSKSNLDGKDVIISILANRYYIQKEYAKSFMLQNVLLSLMDNPNMVILNDIESYINVKDKNKMAQFLCTRFSTGLEDKSISITQLIKYMKGMVYLTANDLQKSKIEFNESGISLDTIPSSVFGYNRIECFDCKDNMEVDYLGEFSYIRGEMNEQQLLDVLLKLETEATENTAKAAKANYLLGNFFYNTSLTGYYRNFLRFGYAGSYRQQFFDPSTKNDLLLGFQYLNTIPPYSDNTTSIADKYLQRAYALASGDEFKARIVFALSKCEQEFNYQKLSKGFNYWSGSHDHKDAWVMISDRKYFKEMMKYKNTKFFEKVQSNCLYFDYYVSHI